jgi:KUP system potassium uptake protein
MTEDDMAAQIPKRRSSMVLTLMALGVVYGDIGTSPLYAVQATFSPGYGIPLQPENIIGGISAIIWALTIVASIKYVILVLRADNNGEGGIMALLALALSSVKSNRRLYTIALICGMLGTALFYGDAVLTPAISVLSAVEGLNVGNDSLQAFVIPISVGILVSLFFLERYGTGVVGTLFGPVVLCWFLAIGSNGLTSIVHQPLILASLNPVHALTFLTHHGHSSFFVLGAVLLAFTGAEALYADMGHFGKFPIRLAWFGVVFPALVANYLGQGALLLDHPQDVSNPFYLGYPSWLLYPMVALATAATVIASQATITGTYSLTKQAIQLRLMPRLRVIHTAASEKGQIYLPAVNWILLFFVLAAVIGFGSAGNIASAYGLSVTATMLTTTLLTFFVIRYGWGYRLWISLAATGFFAAIDLIFFSSSLLKILDGAWFPLLLGTFMFTIMYNWWRGRQILTRRLRSMGIPLDEFIASLALNMPPRVSGTAVFLTPNPENSPDALLHNLKHNKVLHERIIILTVEIFDIPWVVPSKRILVEHLDQQFWRLTLRFGFKEEPDVIAALIEQCPQLGLPFDLAQTSFFLSRLTLLPMIGKPDGMAIWRERMFVAMAKNMTSAVEYFGLPSNKVIEIGTRIEL